MNNKAVKNAELDRVAETLLASSTLRHDEIDEIVARRDLFAAVKRRVVDQDSHPAVDISTIFRPRVLSFAAFAAIALITVISVVSSVVERKKIASGKASQTVTQFAAEEPQRREEIVIKPTEPEQKVPDIEPPVLRPTRERAVATRTDYRPARNAQPEDEPLEFYALADMNSTEALKGGRVVRVDLPRASLVSLGVNIPLENDKQIIKTDLLIGPDGVPRAIRVVE